MFVGETGIRPRRAAHCEAMKEAQHPRSQPISQKKYARSAVIELPDHPEEGNWLIAVASICSDRRSRTNAANAFNDRHQGPLQGTAAR